jgi:hypothetical protein
MYSREDLSTYGYVPCTRCTVADKYEASENYKMYNIKEWTDLSVSTLLRVVERSDQWRTVW